MNASVDGGCMQREFGSSSVVEITFPHNGSTSEYDGGNGAFVYINSLADASDTFLSLGFLEILYGYNSPVALGVHTH